MGDVNTTFHKRGNYNVDVCSVQRFINDCPSQSWRPEGWETLGMRIEFYNHMLQPYISDADIRCLPNWKKIFPKI